MTKMKSLKKALITSAVSMVLCSSMFVGTTYAWFTDAVTSNGNIIQTGTLNVGMYWAEGDEAVPTDANDWKDASTGAIFNNTKWEPGYVEAKHIKIANEGSLALKYKLLIVPNGEVEALADVIDVYYVENATQITGRDMLAGLTPVGTLRDMIEDTDGAVHGALLPVGETATDTYERVGEVTATIAFKMREEAGNEYKGMSIGTDFSIQLLATQYTFEEDGFNNQYDTDATYPVFANNATELTNALENAKPGTVITLAEDVDYDTVTVGELKDVVIKGAEGTTAIFQTTADTKIENVTLQEVEFAYDGTTVDCGVVIDENAQIDNLVIEGCSFTGNDTKAGRGLSGSNNNASIVLKNCTFKDMGYPVYVWGSYNSLTIEDCTFENIKSWAIMPQSGFDGDLTVTGCTFKNCLGGGLIKAGTLTAGHTFTFTNNTITGCTIAGDHNWFQFNVSAGTAVIENNTKDGQPWAPSDADGLK